MNITTAYSCLLGRPWIHAAGSVPSSLHQKIKFIIDDKMIIISGEEDMLVSKLSSTPYIEAAEEALETSFQALEIASTMYVNEEMHVMKAQLSDASLMVAKIMLGEGYQHGHGLGKWGNGIVEVPTLVENKDRFGLGYKPTRDDKKMMAAEKKKKRLARVEGREPKLEKIPAFDLMFRSAGFEFLSPVAAAEEELSEGQYFDLVRPCMPDAELDNWKSVEIAMIYKPEPK